MRTTRTYLVIAAALVLGSLAHSAKANVYVTNIRFNGSTNPAVVCPGTPLTITYILNEFASSGILMEIRSGNNLVHAISVNAGAPGTLRGTNSLVWDGTGTNGLNVGEGAYSVSLTASSLGYETWTQITDDAQCSFIHDPYGIAVNQNTNSLYYGRLFVATASSPTLPYASGIYKLNADGSSADEGIFTKGGYPWYGYSYSFQGPLISPWKLEVSSDDELFINDWNNRGLLLGFNQVLSGDYTNVLATCNYPSPQVRLGGPAVARSDTNTYIYMADTSTNQSHGILRWTLGPDGALMSGDAGTVVVAAGTNSDLSLAPWDVAVDKNGRIYTIQNLNDDDPSPHVLCFPAYDEDSGISQTNADWSIVGENNLLHNAYGIAVNPAATHVAVAVYGFSDFGFGYGGLVILDAKDGTVITNFFADFTTAYLDVAWDNVGNVYGTEYDVWRAFSPPGPNQATTVAVPVVHVINSLQQPTLSCPQGTSETFEFTLAGQNNVTYLVEQSADFQSWNPVTTNYSASAVRQIQITPAEAASFYRARTLP